mmetsp:Transcript_8978/g.31776  ORF Transcript_8978/g.31776 Transcript_8978/m.31776 type:complete len:258 (+) Transcript_8978:480-1253(+)
MQRQDDPSPPRNLALEADAPKFRLQSGGCFGPERRVEIPAGFFVVAALQFAGWLSVMIYSFYFTSAWAQELGTEPGSPEFSKAVRSATLLLIAGSLWFTTAGALLPRFVRLCGGEEEALIVALILLAITLGTFTPHLKVLSSFCAVIVFPTAYQVVARVPYTWIERQPSFDEADRGRLTGRLTVALSASQIVVSLSGGPVAAATGGRLVGAYRVWAAVSATAALLGIAQRLLRSGGWCRRPRPGGGGGKEALLAAAS